MMWDDLAAFVLPEILAIRIHKKRAEGLEEEQEEVELGVKMRTLIRREGQRLALLAFFFFFFLNQKYDFILT